MRNFVSLVNKLILIEFRGGMRRSKWIHICRFGRHVGTFLGFVEDDEGNKGYEDENKRGEKIRDKADKVGWV